MGDFGRGELFEKGFQETLRYRKEKCDSNAPRRYTTSEGFRLGRWQEVRRRDHKKGRLSPDRAQRLEAIGFKWNLLDELFEKGFQETLNYKGRTGDSNAPYDYQTAEGYRLGTWQSRQRRDYRRGKLSNQRIEKLEKIGFMFAKSR